MFHESCLIFLARTWIDINRNFNFLWQECAIKIRKYLVRVHTHTHLHTHKLPMKIWYGGYGPFISIVKTRCPLNISFPSFRIPIYLKSFRSLCKSEKKKRKEENGRETSLSLSLSLLPEILNARIKKLLLVNPCQWTVSVPFDEGGKEEERGLGNEITRVASNNREDVARMQMQRRSKFLFQPRTNQFLYGKAIHVSTVTGFCTCNAKLFSRFYHNESIIFPLQRYLSVDIAYF